MGSLQSIFDRLPIRVANPQPPRAMDAVLQAMAPRGWATLDSDLPEGNCTLAQLGRGARATIAKVQATGPMGAHLLEMGLTPGTPVCLRHRGRHQRVEILVRAYVFSLPVEEASLIRVTTDT